ncbi:MAG: AraC family transcriptional regulator [Bacteroidales bacterium]|nr:AraC family transcriptional regulator [Bacteroidales bacterium]
MRTLATYAVVITIAVSCAGGSRQQEPISVVDDIPLYELGTERLPDLNQARGTHAITVINGELTVIGGHTDGFIPSTTAEYFGGGRWHLINSVYAHDGGFLVRIPDGRFVIGGGSAESFGVGRTFGVEAYDPEEHEFTALPYILDRKRAFASAALLSGGEIVLSGNWYDDDAIAVLAPQMGITQEKKVSAHRASPLIFPVSAHDAYIFGCVDNYGEWRTTVAVDRVNGESFVPEVFDRLSPLAYNPFFSASDYQIGDYRYLIPARNTSDGRIGFLKLEDGRFSLLETEGDIQPKGVDGDSLTFFTQFLVDKTARTAYLLGYDSVCRVYVVKLYYDASLVGDKASWSIYCTKDPLEGFPKSGPAFALLPDGRIVCAGGIEENNFSPSKAVFAFSPGLVLEKAAIPWAWIVAGILLIALLTLALVAGPGRKKTSADDVPQAAPEDLMSRIVALMEDKEAFRRPGLRKADVAEALGTNVTYISACINTQRSQTFPEFIAGYRVRYAQNLMRAKPQMRLSDVAEESGFSSEQSFFRTFKSMTGMTPQEWKDAAKKA